jgi:hypothetical protein
MFPFFLALSIGSMFEKLWFKNVKKFTFSNYNQESVFLNAKQHFECSTMHDFINC